MVRILSICRFFILSTFHFSLEKSSKRAFTSPSLSFKGEDVTATARCSFIKVRSAHQRAGVVYIPSLLRKGWGGSLSLISAEEVAGVNLFFYVIEDGVVAVGDDGMRLRLELSQVVDDL